MIRAQREVSWSWGVGVLSGLVLFGGASLAEAQGVRVDRKVAITVDDLPRNDSASLPNVRRINAAMLRALRQHGAPATGFVNESKLQVEGEIDERAAVLRSWLDGGMLLGNHGFSHLRLDAVPLDHYLDDIVRGEVVTRRLLRETGKEGSLYYRYPFNHTGATEEVKQRVENFLRVRGYRVAPFTVENSDYIFNRVFHDARRRNDLETVGGVGEAYLEFTEKMFLYYEARSRTLFGREIPQVLLLHANEINAEHLDAILRRLRQRGYSFITLDAALSDPAYLTPDRYVGVQGLSWLHRWTLALDRPMELASEPEPPQWLMEMYREMQGE